MLIIFTIFALQSASVSEAMRGLEAVNARAKRVMDRGFNCMDEQVKSHFLSHPADITPQSTVDAALAACKYLKQDYAEAVTAPNSYISASKAKELADDWFASLREVYLKHLDETLAKPEIADARVKVVIQQWRGCITDKAADWSRLRDEAATVGRAAVTTCDKFRQNAESAVGFQLRSKGMAASGASRVIEKVQNTMVDVATATVISERAKRLPKK